MHKKSIETPDTSPEKPGSTMTPPPPPPPPQEKPADTGLEEEQRTKDTLSPITRDELRENSIAVLRAKAQEHSAKMLGTVSDRATVHIQHKEEAEDRATEEETAEVEKSD